MLYSVLKRKGFDSPEESEEDDFYKSSSSENDESEIRTISASVQENQENQALALPNQVVL